MADAWVVDWAGMRVYRQVASLVATLVGARVVMLAVMKAAQSDMMTALYSAE